MFVQKHDNVVICIKAGELTDQGLEPLEPNWLHCVTPTFMEAAKTNKWKTLSKFYGVANSNTM